MNSLIWVGFGSMVGLIVGLFIIIKCKNDEIRGLRATISWLERCKSNLEIELSEEKFRHTMTKARNGKSKIKIEKITTEKLGATGWYFSNMPTDLIKRELAYKIADKILENGYMDYVSTGIANSYDGRAYHTAHIEIIKRG